MLKFGQGALHKIATCLLRAYLDGKDVATMGRSRLPRALCLRLQWELRRELMAASGEIYDLLRQEIVSGKYEPMHLLDPRLVAADHCTSVAPVREALIRLSERGLVRWEKKRGFFVEKVSGQAVLFHLNQLMAAYKYAINRAKEYQPEFRAAGDVDLSPKSVNPAEYIEWQGSLANQIFSDAEREFISILWDRIWIYRNSYLSDGATLEYLRRASCDLNERFAQRQFDECSELATRVFQYVIERIPDLLPKVNA